jgi:transaldolase
MDQAISAKMHSADRMASDKLQEGSFDFTNALENLEKMLETLLRELNLQDVGHNGIPLQIIGSTQ